MVSHTNVVLGCAGTLVEVSARPKKTRNMSVQNGRYWEWTSRELVFLLLQASLIHYIVLSLNSASYEFLKCLLLLVNDINSFTITFYNIKMLIYKRSLNCWSFDTTID